MTSKNILLIGPTESGKSTLGNVLINRNDNFEKVFEENGWTKETKIEEVEIDNINYRIIDTVGWHWNASESDQQVLTKIAESFHTPEGKIDRIYRILLVTKGSGSWRYVIAAFNLLKKLDPELLNYTTIIRSNFAEFEDDEKRERFVNDSKNPQIVEPEIAEIVSQFSFIPIDNPWTNTSFPKRNNETEEEFEARKKIREEAREINKETRKLSRKIVFDHLKAECQEDYHVDLDTKISNFLDAESKKTAATETRNILLIGATGSGKSVLGNTLINRNNNFTEVFGESCRATSETRKTKIEEMEEENIKYRVIEAVGWDHTSMDEGEVAERLTNAFQATGGNINRILLVIERFDKRNCHPFYLIKKIDPEILKHTTIICRSFVRFRNSEVCKKDIDSLKDLKQEDSWIAKIANAVPIVHVNNPSLDISVSGNEDESEVEEANLELTINRKIRKLSREKILDHLKEHSEIHHLEMENLEERINDFFGIVSESDEEETETTEETNEGGNADNSGLKNFLIFVIIIAVIGIIGYCWPTKKEKET